MECVVCHGSGCDKCNGDGWELISGCRQVIARPMFETIGMIDMAEKGHLPLARGVLDQSAWFIEAYRFYTNDMEKLKAKLRR